MQLHTSIAAALLLISAALTGADDTTPSTRDSPQLDHHRNLHGLEKVLATGLPPADSGSVSTNSLQIPGGNASLTHGSISGEGDAGNGSSKQLRSGRGRASSSAAWPDGYDTAVLQQPISFPDGWLAQQASNLLAFSLQALERQAAEEQVGNCRR